MDAEMASRDFDESKIDIQEPELKKVAAAGASAKALRVTCATIIHISGSTRYTFCLSQLPDIVPTWQRAPRLLQSTRPNSDSSPTWRRTCRNLIETR